LIGLFGIKLDLKPRSENDPVDRFSATG
jgi:hypothetical protein